MSWLESFCSSHLTPSLLIFLLILLGLLIGKIKFFHLQLGIVGVLLLSLLCGYWLAQYPIEETDSVLEICSFLSSFSTPLFISVIGLQAGSSFWNKKQTKGWKAFLAGMCVVGGGTMVAFLILQSIPTIEKDLLLGLFAGSMTSTPALAASQELCGTGAAVALGYGLSYWIGLILIVLLVQIFYKGESNSQSVQSFSKAQPSKRSKADALIILSSVIVSGYVIGWILPIGTTGGVLLCGFIFGLISVKSDKTLPNMESYKKLGLTLLLIGAGIPAGKQLFFNHLSHYFIYGTLIAFGAILMGYLSIRFLLGYSKNEALILLSGGMTSTPAIAALEEKEKSIDLSLYALSYTGALTALLISVHILFQI